MEIFIYVMTWCKYLTYKAKTEFLMEYILKWLIVWIFDWLVFGGLITEKTDPIMLRPVKKAVFHSITPWTRSTQPPFVNSWSSWQGNTNSSLSFFVHILLPVSVESGVSVTIGYITWKPQSSWKTHIQLHIEK